MKRLLLFFLLINVSWISTASENLIAVSVFIENRTIHKFEKGLIQFDKEKGLVFSVSGNTDNEFLIPRGKYDVKFESKEFSSWVVKPKRINKKNNSIKVILFPKENQLKIDFEKSMFIQESNEFIVHSLIGEHNNLSDFREKYDIGFKLEACMIDPFSMKKAREQNLKLARQLTEKYGDSWKKDLPLKPFGL
ncbi:hypothetical protein ABN763_08690 [Spongiivirga sp. MCCC 1A20706]|uniref:FEKKY domain-containing protein n=1 Tax=Spongiivirga sp. MCCC 1A20706 TaxID=3160963 RepID=UPI00397770F3